MVIELYDYKYFHKTKEENLTTTTPPPEQEAMADGREGLLALREAVERLVEMARGLVERAEEAATEADKGEVGPIPYRTEGTTMVVVLVGKHTSTQTNNGCFLVAYHMYR